MFGYVHGFVFASIAAVGACLATLVDLVEDKAHIHSQTGVLLLVGAVSIYLLVIAGLHALADTGLRNTLPALVVVAVLWVVGLLGLAPGTSVLLVGLALAISLADYVRRTNRACADQRLISGSSATATNSSERYMLDQWNSRIGRTSLSSLLRLARCHIRWASTRNPAPSTTATIG